MGLRMIAESVPASRDLAYELGTRARESSHQKKSRSHRVPFEKCQQLRSNGRIRPVVKRQRNLTASARMVQSRAENFRCGMHRAPRSYSCRDSCGASRGARHANGPKVQAHEARPRRACPKPSPQSCPKSCFPPCWPRPSSHRASSSHKNSGIMPQCPSALLHLHPSAPCIFSDRARQLHCPEPASPNLAAMLRARKWASSSHAAVIYNTGAE